MLRDVDLSVAAWLAALLPAGTRVVFDAPGRIPEVGTDSDAESRTDPAPGRGSGTGRRGAVARGRGAGRGGALAMYLHGVQEEPDGGSVGWSEVRGPDGMVIGREPPDRRYRLTYLLTAWAGDILTEHDLLGRVLAGAAAVQVLPRDFRTGSLAREDRPVLLFCAPERSNCDPRELWAAWRVPPRTAIELSVLAPLPRELVTDLAAPPAEIDLRSERREPTTPASIDALVSNGSRPVLRRRRPVIEEG